MFTLQLEQIKIPAGQQILLENINWADFENILVELGENRTSLISYRANTLEIMTPLAAHEDDKEILGDLIKILLEESNTEFRALGSNTFKHSYLKIAIEPDQCFYIQNEAKIRGKRKIDLSTDPPPDLALEIDITSRTHPQIYEAIGVPELWRKEGESMQILLLKDGIYQESKESSIFPNFPILMLLDYLAQSKIKGRNQVMKSFRQWVQANVPTLPIELS